jgi:1-phosphofructokinase family hexose kinase
MAMILTVTLNPCVDKSIALDRLVLGAFNTGAEAHDVAGGKGTNVARMVKHLGAPVRSLVLLGGETGRVVERLIRSHDGIDPMVVWTEAPTRNIVTVHERDRKRATAYVEPNGPVSESEAGELEERYAAALDDVEIVCFGGSAPDPRLDDIYRRMIEWAKRRGIRTILDSRGEALRRGLQAVPFMVKPNVAETEHLLGRTLADEAERWAAVQWYRELGIEIAVLSMGKAGALVDWSGRRWRAGPPQVEEVNPVGSGDCLVAGFACGLLWGWTPESTIGLAVAAGAANAAVWDAASPSRADVEALIGRVSLEAKE